MMGRIAGRGLLRHEGLVSRIGRIRSEIRAVYRSPSRSAAPVLHREQSAPPPTAVDRIGP